MKGSCGPGRTIIDSGASLHVRIRAVVRLAAGAVRIACRRASSELGVAPSPGVHEPPEDVAGGEDPHDVGGGGAVQARLERAFAEEGVDEDRRAVRPRWRATGRAGPYPMLRSCISASRRSACMSSPWQVGAVVAL